MSTRHQGPSLVILTVIYVALMLAGGTRLSAAFHIPHDSASAIEFMAKNGRSIQWGSFWELASAIPFGIFTAATVSRLRFHGVRAAGEQIASLGGIGTTFMLILSALASWSLTKPGVVESAGAVNALQALSFDGGGPGFAVFLGLFVTGVSVTAGLYRLIPRWLMWLGIAVAAASELASLTLLNSKAGYLIPVGRFVGIVWMLGVSLTLPAVLKPSKQEAESRIAV